MQDNHLEKEDSNHDEWIMDILNSYGNASPHPPPSNSFVKPIKPKILPKGSESEQFGFAIRRLPLSKKKKHESGRHDETRSFTFFNKSESHDAFDEACDDKGLMMNPKKLNFVPSHAWSDVELTFGDLVESYFRKRNTDVSRFSFKLFNALLLSSENPDYFKLIGVKWVNDNVVKVDKMIFSKLLGIKSIDGSLFHRQGNFKTHGFIELQSCDELSLITKDDLIGVDFDNIRLMKHSGGLFRKDSSEEELRNLKYVDVRRRSKANG